MRVYACRVDESRASQVAESFGFAGCFGAWEQIVACPDIAAVDICLPHHLHAPVAIAAARAGKHVLIEKPLATSLDDADRMIHEAERAGVVLAVLENYRLEPAAFRIRRLLDDGIIGKPFLAIVNELRCFGPLIVGSPAYDWRRRKSQSGGGVLLDAGIHLVALLNSVFGKPRRVFAKCASASGVFEGEDTSVLTLEYDSGLLASWVQTWSAAGAPGLPLVSIYGTGGSMFEVPAKRMPPRAKFQIGALRVYSTRDPKYRVEPTESDMSAAKKWMQDTWRTVPADDTLRLALGQGVLVDLDGEYPTYSVFEKAINNFIDCVAGNATPAVPGRLARQDMEVVLAAYQSAKTTREILLSPDD